MKLLVVALLVACASPQRSSAVAHRPRMVFAEVTNSWVPELRCDDGTPGYNRDGAIVLCLGPARR